MSKGGELLVAPRYDAIGEQLEFLNNSKISGEGEYRLVEFNGKLGVINQYLEEVLPCDNDFILPVSCDQFLVRQSEGYTILDGNGSSLPGSHYQKLEYAGFTKDGAYYYTIYDGKKKGLINAEGDTLLSCVYNDIKTLDWQAAPFLTQVQSDQGWWRLTARGGKTLLRELADVRSPHPDLLLVATKQNHANHFFACDRQGQPIKALIDRPTLSGQYLGPELVCLEQIDLENNSNRIQVLFQLRKQQSILPQLKQFRPLDGQYAIASESRSLPGIRGKAELETLLSPQGEIVDTNNWFVKVENWPGVTDSYLVRAPGGWGVIAGDGRQIVPMEYTEIGELEDGLALVIRNGVLGVIAGDGRVIAPAEYTAIHRRDNILMLEKGDHTTMLYLDDSLQMVSLREYQNLRTLTVAPPSYYRIARNENFEQLRNALDREKQRREDTTSPGINPNNFTTLSRAATTNTEQVITPDTSRLTPWFFRDTSLVNTPLRPTAAARALGMDTAFLNNHTDPFLSLGYYTRFYAKEAVVPAAYFQQLVVGSQVSLRPQRLFVDRKGKLLTEKYLGFRIFDYQEGWQYAPALKENGRFCFLGRDGELLPSFADTITEFTFVSRPKRGLLRVCVGGELVNTEEGKIPQHPLTSLNGMLDNFFTTVADGTLDNSHQTMIARSLPGSIARWGILDTLGNWAVPPVYEYLHDPINGQMIAYQNGNYGVIDAHGDTIVPFQYKRIINYNGFWRVNSEKIGEVYFNWRGHQILDIGVDSISLFQENYASYRREDRWSYVDKQGTLVPGGGYLQARPFGEGWAAVQVDSTDWAFIDTSGQLQTRLPATTFHDFSHFSSARCLFRRGVQFGYLDRTFREMPLPGVLRKAADFDRGRAIVELETGVAVIDTSGNFLIQPGTYLHLTAWNEANLAVATLPNNQKCLVDSQGVRLHETTFDDILLEGGLPYPARTDHRWGYIDKKGREVIAPKYTAALPFMEGFARVRNQRSGDRWLFIQPDGRPISERTYVSAEDFFGGQASIRTPNGTGKLLLPNGQERELPDCFNLFIDGTFVGCNPNGPNAFFTDHNGDPVFLSSYDKIKPFESREMTFVQKYGRWGIIDRRGMQLVACKYYMYASRPDGIFKVGPPAFGIYDREGKLIVPPVYDNLVLLEKGLFRVERGGKVGYLNTDGEEIWGLGN